MARRSDVGSAFTLVEFLAVLAIITILALIVLENVLEKVKRAQQEAEVQNLRNIATALTQSVVRVQAVPCDTNWVPQIATELGLAEHRIGQNRLGNNRALYVDSSFRIGTNIAGTYKGAPTGLPFTQNVLGSQAIISPRMVLVSSTAAPLPSGLSFDTFLNLPKGTIPASGFSSWKGTGDDLIVQPIDLRNLFHRVVLNNQDSTRLARYSLETTNNLITIQYNTNRVMYVLHNTAINLHFTNNQVQVREFVTEDVSYAFEDGVWSGYTYYGRNGLLGPFGQMANAFLAAPTNSTAKMYASQQAVLDAMYDYLFYVGLWSLANFPSDTNVSRIQIPEYRQALDAQTRLTDVSTNLIR